MNSTKRQWTRGEKWLWAAPLLLLIGAGAALFGPDIARRKIHHGFDAARISHFAGFDNG